MRHAVQLSGVLGVAVAAPLLACLWPAAARPPAAALTGAAEDGPGGARTVRYHGVRVPVPEGWTVYRLDRDPSRCVRYDRHAVYLGRPGPQPDCPARVVGRTEAVHVQPLDGRPEADGGPGASSRTIVRGSRLASYTVRRSTGQEARLALPEAGVAITGVYGTDPSLLQWLLRGTRLDPAGPAVPPGHHRPGEPDPPTDPTDDPSFAMPPFIGPPGPDGEDGDDGAQGDGGGDETKAEGAWAAGRGFDTCTAPALSSMRAWRPSFKITNIYIGGAARGCAQPNLTPGWVRKVRKMGYRITPTYVGLQAPCGSRPQRFTAGNAASKGRKAAVDAARRARALGIPPHKPIYFDMEAYRGNTACRRAVLRFVNGWVKRLKSENYKPCLYSSAASGIRDVGRSARIARPGCVWFANWDGRARVYGDPYLPDHWWTPHRRIKQYRGGHRERHGGVTLNIDSNIVDGSVY
ncbi:DUF1906 domain-containing protein [Actinomadura sp. NEAU-AAG7]|uniref:DUF1906 domain-containing protein n=1 Tax=Actinomadura sp. NEAU-AAG7 TaxID=2839640 RepID=UPI001BE4B013|nr:DUF1906 domain-containing protein [Actinomadura sp. NEAU-AAG7]MBT2209482.1 DUF1906 domain-containing protein [Actinomadura sp. NEAU-AAG7]